MKKFLSVILSILIAVIMTASILADVAFVPSIENKLAPEVVPVEGNSDVAAVIYNQAGEKIRDVTWVELIVTPLAKADECGYEDIRKNLKDAKAQIDYVETLADLNANLEQIAKKIDPNYTADDFIVTNLFDVSLVNQAGYVLELEPGNHVVVTLDLGLTDDDPTPIIIHRADSGEWLIVGPEDLVRNSDNTLSITFYELCPVATLTLANDYSVQNPDVISPRTGLGSVYVIGGVSVLVIMLCVGAVIASKAKKAK